MNLFKWIFTVDITRDRQYRKICIFGHTFLKQRKIPYLIQRVENLQTLINYCIDITQIPPARGIQLMMQQASLCVLNRMASVFRQHNIKWWLDSGTLIGQVRHNGGFVPWDDDIDIAMMREDYEKIIPILEQEFCGDGFWFDKREIVRLFYKSTPAQVDIFPVDRGPKTEPPTGAEYKKFVSTLDKIKSRKYHRKKRAGGIINADNIKCTLAERDHILFNDVPASDTGFLFFGVETNVKNRCVFAYDDVFPLTPAKFCGVDTFIPNNSEYYLYNMYGDFMNIPNATITMHPDIVSRMNLESFKDCQHLIKNFMPRSNKKK